MYDYLEAMKQDIKQYLDDNADYLNLNDMDRDDLEEDLNDRLFTEDSITGNGSGSYTFSRAEAKENLAGNEELLVEALTEFSVESEVIVDKFLSMDYEYFDVSIRCYLLNQAINEVLNELFTE